MKNDAATGTAPSPIAETFHLEHPNESLAARSEFPQTTDYGGSADASGDYISEDGGQKLNREGSEEPKPEANWMEDLDSDAKVANQQLDDEFEIDFGTDNRTARSPETRHDAENPTADAEVSNNAPAPSKADPSNTWRGVPAEDTYANLPGVLKNDTGAITMLPSKTSDAACT